ncbi:DUF2384 domain-containing protein [Bradyrhizobium sp. AUGA SZCCT0240]|uniref:competence protein CoiA family protein n=1 Tax=unclassified Bradyrhizobium TaxID=2631580 RepID=UPI001BABEE93|nr:MULTISPECIES: competence protein CoiA family protein [unclassified Bradyrhizobium]MBR1238602.1 DUF2384 domain-containing protein [Bradyrhizobium sp. AUGA SZCCT0274]MBR1256597.1 DUF2384 domain-containing protein [Bradyrhizobium sp. AUGA SZCCT0240]
MLDSTATAHDVAGFGSERATLAWAIGPEGRIAHISEVANGIRCGCRCPDKNCKEPLIARTNHPTTPHFAHTANTACNGGGPETVIHLLAKEAIADHKKLHLCEQRASFKLLDKQVRPEGVVEFDSVVLEDRAIDDIIPDVVASKNGHALLVEIAVTHVCDAEKIARIRTNGVAAIEINLSGLSRRADRAAIAQAVIHDAPRRWIFHPTIDAKSAELRKRHKAAEAAKRKTFLDAVNRLIDDYGRGVGTISQQPPPEMPDHDLLRAAQLLDHVGVRVDGGGCFTWPLARWQLYIIRNYVFAPKALATAAIRDELRGAGAIRPTFHYVPKDLEAALESSPIGFLTPYKAIDAYLKHLAGNGVLAQVRYGYGHQNYGYQPSSETLASIAKHYAKLERIEQRLQTVRDVAQAILNELPENERGTTNAEAWMQLKQPEFQLSFANAIQSDSVRFADMLAALRRIERMVFKDAAIAELCLRLPIEGERQRRREAKANAARELAAQKAIAEEQARVARVASITSTAEADLGAEAATWLEAIAPDGTSPVSLAALHPEGLQRALGTLRVLIGRRNAQRKAQSVIDGFVSLLWESAQNELGEKAPYFMRSPYPALGGKRPLEYCTDRITLAKCRDLLKIVAKR